MLSQSDVELMNLDYDRQLAELEERLGAQELERGAMGYALELEQHVQSQIQQIVSGERAPDSFYGGLLEQMTAYPGGRLEVRLHHLPIQWNYRVEE